MAPNNYINNRHLYCAGTDIHVLVNNNVFKHKNKQQQVHRYLRKQLTYLNIITLLTAFLQAYQHQLTCFSPFYNMGAKIKENTMANI